MQDSVTNASSLIGWDGDSGNRFGRRMITSPNIRFPSSEENAVAGGDGSDLRKKDLIFFGGADIARMVVAR